VLRLGCLLAVWLALTAALAQPWTVQIAAYRDFRVASEVVSELRELGFDAYHEFTMNQGLQYARVRVGCFIDSDGAANAAALLKTGVTREAVVVPMSEQAEPRPCVRFDLGFNEPGSWGIHSSQPEAVVFWVELSGHRGYIAHTASGWQVLQREPSVTQGVGWLATPSPNPGATQRLPAVSGVSYGSSPHLDTSVIKARLPSNSLVVAAGELIWSSSHAAIVRSNGTLLAVSLVTKP